MAATKQAEETVAERGVDLEVLGAFGERTAERPDEAVSERSATGVGQRTAGQTLAKAGSFATGGREIDRENREYTLSLRGPEEVGAVLGFAGPTG